MVNSCKKINYSLKDIFLDCRKNAIGAIRILLVVRAISLLIYNELLCLILQVVVGMMMYIIVAIVLRNDSLYYFVSIIRKKIKSG